MMEGFTKVSIFRFIKQGIELRSVKAGGNSSTSEESVQK